MKKIIIAAGVGLIFLLGGLTLGLLLAPLPKLPPPVVTTEKPIAPIKKVDTAIFIPTDPTDAAALRKAYESLLDLNQALQQKSQEIKDQQEKLGRREEELKAEEANITRSHQKLGELFTELQNRLVLVENKQMDQLQHQVVVFTTMELPQTIDLLRAKDDADVVRLFALMDDKQLAKIINEWKKTYPDDTKRLLTDISGIGRIQQKDQMAVPAELNPASSHPDSSPTPTALANSATNAPPSLDPAQANPDKPSATP